MKGLLFLLTNTFSDIGKSLYWFKFDSVFDPVANSLQNTIIVFSHEEPPIFQTSENPRPLKRVGWPFSESGLQWVRMKPSDLNINSPFSEMFVDVYIQSHALLRLSERIDCFEKGLIHFNLCISLLHPKVFYDNNNNPLVEFRFYQIKVGYLRVDFVEGIILVRTFLFITNSGTPEGQKLGNNTGLQKLDKKYLAIDKLSTFMTTDIGSNQDVRGIFIASGCQCLIDLYEKMKPILTKQSDHFDSQLMLKYIEYNKSNDILEPNEDTL